MKKHNIDSIIKNAVEESKDFYDSEALEAKERIWNAVRPRKKVIPLFYRLAAVASILLLLFLSIATYSTLKYKSKVNQLVKTNTQLKLDKQSLAKKNETNSASNQQKPDTVFIEKKITQLKPIVTTEKLIDTVFIKQIVYVEKKVNSTKNSSNKSIAYSTNKTDKNNGFLDEVAATPNSEVEISQNIPKSDIVSNSSSAIETSENDIQKVVIIKNEKALKKRKSKKFKIKFGGTRSKIGKETLALRTEIK